MEVRLTASGPGKHSGIVEVLHREGWRRICHEETWETVNAKVICRQLGYAKSLSTQGSTISEEEAMSGNLWLTGLNCANAPFQAAEVSRCESPDWNGGSECRSGKALTVSCGEGEVVRSKSLV